MRQENNEDRMKVYLIGAGPGDPGLLTIKGKDILEKADVVVYDYLANDTLLGYARPDAERIYVGKVAGNHALPQDGINKLIIEKAKEGITNLLKQTADNSIAKSGAFQKMEKQKSDINFFASMAAIPAPYQEQVSMGLPAEVKAEDITIIAGLNFEKGRIALKTENYTENEAVKALMKKQLEAFGKANNTFVKYFPASTLMFVNLGIKGEGLYNLLSENKEFRNTVSIQSR